MARGPKLGSEHGHKYSAWAMSFKKKVTIQEDSVLEKHLSVTTLSSEGQIIRYDTDRAFAWYGCFLVIKGTIVQWSFVFKALLLCGIATALGFVRCPIEDASIEKHWSACLPHIFLTDSSLLSFSSLVAFLLGTFVKDQSFKRWWDSRGYVQKMMSYINEVAMLSVAYIKSPKPEEAELAMKVREELIRYLNMGHALVYQQAREEPDLDFLMNMNLVTKEERAILEHSHYRSHVAFGWASELLTRAMERGLIFTTGGATGMRVLQENVCRIRSAASDMFQYIDTQIPYGYIYLMTMLTRIHLLLMTVYGGGIIAKGFDNRSVYRLIFGYLWLTFNIFIYEGILQFAHELENPFGYDRQDFPLLVFKQKVVKTSSELISTDVSPNAWLHGSCAADAAPEKDGDGHSAAPSPAPSKEPAVKMVRMESAAAPTSPPPPSPAPGSSPAPASQPRESTHVPAAVVDHA